MLTPYRLKLSESGKVVFPVRIQPQAKETKLVGVLADGSLKIAIAATPVDNKANDLLLKFLAQQFGVKKEQIMIKSGAGARYKLISVVDSSRIK